MKSVIVFDMDKMDWKLPSWWFPVFLLKGGTSLMVKINGKQIPAAGTKLSEYLISAGYHLQRIAVECNGQIIPKSQYETFILQDEDSLEVVSFVGGG